MKLYLCIGGPYDGLRLTSKELAPRVVAYCDSALLGTRMGDVLREGGSHAEFAGDYFDYNRADARAWGPPMVRLHRSLLS